MKITCPICGHNDRHMYGTGCTHTTDGHFCGCALEVGDRHALLSAVERTSRAAANARAAYRSASATRDKAIIAAFEAGARYRDIAEQSGLTPWRITQVLRAARDRGDL